MTNENAPKGRPPTGRKTLGVEDIPAGDGTFEVQVGQDVLPVLKKGFDKVIGPFFLVAFNGAVSIRGKADVHPPFFSGRRIANEIDIPLLSFSDPTMAHDDSIKLAFYAGSRKAPDLPDTLARVVDLVAQQTGSKPILMGGSGGGFASLNVGYRCESEVFAFVWNPQTQASKYDMNFVAHYIDVAFPGVRDPFKKVSAEAAQVFKAEGICDAVMDIRKKMKTVYLQNISDWHVNAHLKPFQEGLEWRFMGGKSGMISDKMDIAVCLLDWGEGHAAAPKDLIKETLLNIMEGKTPVEIAEKVLSDPKNDIGNLDVILVPEDFQTQILREPGIIDVKVCSAMPLAGVEYAFYLKQGQKSLKKKFYQVSCQARFEDPGFENLAIQVFIRDFNGKILIKTVTV